MTGNERKKIVEKIADKLEVSGYVSAGIFRITVTGNSRVHIENHRGILEYEQDSIKINCGKTIVAVLGDKLEIEAINKTELLVGGNIASVNLER